jgi:hypothetical protein
VGPPPHTPRGKHPKINSIAPRLLSPRSGERTAWPQAKPHRKQLRGTRLTSTPTRSNT